MEIIEGVTIVMHSDHPLVMQPDDGVTLLLSGMSQERRLAAE